MKRYGTYGKAVSQRWALARDMDQIALSGSRLRASAIGEYHILSHFLVKTLDGH
jgi:hypothetical protein